MKINWNLTTIIGLCMLVIATVMLFLDMHLSINPNYTFELESNYIYWGWGIGLLLIIMPEDKLRGFITKWLNSKFKSK